MRYTNATNVDMKSTNTKRGSKMKYLILALAVMAVSTQAQDVKYCKNYETGEVIVVEANMPCPYPMAEL